MHIHFTNHDIHLHLQLLLESMLWLISGCFQKIGS